MMCKAYQQCDPLPGAAVAAVVAVAVGTAVVAVAVGTAVAVGLAGRSVVAPVRTVTGDI